MMREALAHYEELASKCQWHRSDIRQAIRTYYSEAPLPPAEGAEENIIYHNLTQPFRQILQSVALHGYDIVFAERDCVKCATDFTTLHAQRLAEKMVEERMEQYKAQFKDRPNPRDVNPYDSKGIKRIRNSKKN